MFQIETAAVTLREPATGMPPVAIGADGWAPGAIELSLRSERAHEVSGRLRRFVRRRGQLVRDPVEQPGEVGVGQTAARNCMTGMDDTGVIARESHPNTRK